MVLSGLSDPRDLPFRQYLLCRAELITWRLGRGNAEDTKHILRSYKYPHNHHDALIMFTNLSTLQGMTQGQYFKQSLTGLNSEFSFSLTSCLTKAEEPSRPYYLPIAGGRIIGFIPFPRVLVLCEMQSVSSRIWTRVAMSISCDDNHYNRDLRFRWNIHYRYIYNKKIVYGFFSSQR